MNSKLEKKLSSVSGGYNVNDFSIGRLMYLVGFSQDFGLNLDSNELRQIGDRIKEKLSIDFDNCIIPAVSNILQNFYSAKLNLNNPGVLKINSEWDLIQLLVKRRTKSLRVETKVKEAFADMMKKKSEIKRLTENNPVEMYFIDKNSLEFQNGSKKNALKYIELGKKTPESLVPKFINRTFQFFCPETSTLKKMDLGFISKADERDSIEKRLNIDTYSKYARNYMKRALESGKDFYQFHYGNSNEHLTDSGIQLGGKFNSLAGDVLLIDGARAKIITSERDCSGLKKIILNELGFYMGVLESRFDDNLKLGSKDKSITFGIKVEGTGSYGEIKLQSEKDNLDAELGEKAHHKYKLKRKREMDRGLSKHPDIQLAYFRLNQALDLL